MTTTETEGLEHLASRIDALEQKIDRLLATPTRGGSGLERLGDRIDRIEAAIDAFGTFAERLPVIADAAGSGATWAWRQAEAAGVDPLRAGQQGAALALELAKEENLALAQQLLARRRSLQVALQALDRVSDDDLETVVTRGAALTGTLAKLLRSDALERLLTLGADPAALKTAEGATTALVETRKEPIEPVGPIGALFKLGDPDVKRAIGFSLSLAKRFGQILAR